MKKIIAIGGAVVKTGAHEHLKENISIRWKWLHGKKYPTLCKKKRFSFLL